MTSATWGPGAGDGRQSWCDTWALMGMEVWARARWEKLRMRTRKDPSAKDTAHWIPAALSKPITSTTIIDCLIILQPKLLEHDTWQPSNPIRIRAPSLTTRCY